ncbi:hypothetical protein NEOC65_000363 [Neochlamydia sp. AcF65]|nr:hypothetical protein [Neochlamydia sp. AcF65]MBS4169751.1 hypothetical protein [Neochlamydia sp. AcF95]
MKGSQLSRNMKQLLLFLKLKIDSAFIEKTYRSHHG